MKKINLLIASSIFAFSALSHADLAEQMTELASQKYSTKGYCDHQSTKIKFDKKFENYKFSDVTNYARGYIGLAKSTNSSVLETMSNSFLSPSNFDKVRVSLMIEASGRFCKAMESLLEAEQEIKDQYRK